MSVTVEAIVTCDQPGCGKTVRIVGANGINMSGVLRAARHQFGWVASKDHALCVEHRKVPVERHAFVPNPLGGWMADHCGYKLKSGKECGEYENRYIHKAQS